MPLRREIAGFRLVRFYNPAVYTKFSSARRGSVGETKPGLKLGCQLKRLCRRQNRRHLCSGVGSSSTANY